MTPTTRHVLTLDRLLDDAEESALDAERDLAAALLDLDAAYRREADLAAELIECRRTIGAQQETIDEQQQLIAAHQHAAVLAMEAHRRQAAELDAWRARVMGGLWAWAPEGSAN